MTPLRYLSLALIFSAVVSAYGQTQPATSAGPPDLLIAPPNVHKDPPIKLSFPIGPGVGHGDWIYVPVTLGGKEHLFIVDTGSQTTLIDSTLAGDLGPEKNQTTGKAKSGAGFTARQYQMPMLIVGGKTLPNRGGLVGTIDCTLLRARSGVKVEGLLGVDVLANYVVRFDFQNHIMEMGDLPLAQDPGTPFPIEWTSGITAIATRFVDIPNALVVLDTGDSEEGGLASALLPRLAKEEITSYVTPAVDAAGEKSPLSYTIHRTWSFAGTQFHDTTLDEGAWNAFALDIMADFTWTFDFPNNRVYVKNLKPHHANHPVRWLPVMSKDGQVLVHLPTVADRTQGFQEGDQLLKIDGKDVAGRELWSVREQMCLTDTVLLTIRRGDKTLDVRFDHRILPTATAPATATTSAPSSRSGQ